jgi:hypothetical protein
MTLLSDEDLAQLAHDAGFPIAGFWREVYEGAEILVPAYYFTDETHVIGRVLKVERHVVRHNGYERTVAVVESMDGLQRHVARDPLYGVFFALPQEFLSDFVAVSRDNATSTHRKGQA